MKRGDSSRWALTTSQQERYQAIQARLSSIQGKHRPFLLTGDLGVGKSFLACRLVSQSGAYYNIAANHLSELLETYSLSNLTPEAVVRFLRTLIKDGHGCYSIVDGFEPLLSLWATERPQVLPNFFVSLSRVVLDQPLLVVVQTSPYHLAYTMLEKEEWWPWERRFRLDLTLEDKEVVARNWSLDPIRAHVAANLYQLLAAKLER